MTLIEEDHYISINTVIRVIKNEMHKSHKFYLPEVLSIDEFKSLKNVDSAMNVILDLYLDRRKCYLKEYLMSFTNAAVVLDKFHIVQMFTREMNKARIKAMKKLNPRNRDYKLLKRYWK